MAEEPQFQLPYQTGSSMWKYDPDNLERRETVTRSVHEGRYDTYADMLGVSVFHHIIDDADWVRAIIPLERDDRVKWTKETIVFDPYRPSGVADYGVAPTFSSYKYRDVYFSDRVGVSAVFNRAELDNSPTGPMYALEVINHARLAAGDMYKVDAIASLTALDLMNEQEFVVKNMSRRPGWYHDLLVKKAHMMGMVQKGRTTHNGMLNAQALVNVVEARGGTIDVLIGTNEIAANMKASDRPGDDYYISGRAGPQRVVDSRRRVYDVGGIDMYVTNSLANNEQPERTPLMQRVVPVCETYVAFDPNYGVANHRAGKYDGINIQLMDEWDTGRWVEIKQSELIKSCMLWRGVGDNDTPAELGPRNFSRAGDRNVRNFLDKWMTSEMRYGVDADGNTVVAKHIADLWRAGKVSLETVICAAYDMARHFQDTNYKPVNNPRGAKPKTDAEFTAVPADFPHPEQYNALPNTPEGNRVRAQLASFHLKTGADIAKMKKKNTSQKIYMEVFTALGADFNKPDGEIQAPRGASAPDDTPVGKAINVVNDVIQSTGERLSGSERRSLEMEPDPEVFDESRGELEGIPGDLKSWVIRYLNLRLTVDNMLRLDQMNVLLPGKFVLDQISYHQAQQLAGMARNRTLRQTYGNPQPGKDAALDDKLRTKFNWDKSTNPFDRKARLNVGVAPGALMGKPVVGGNVELYPRDGVNFKYTHQMADNPRRKPSIIVTMVPHEEPVPDIMGYLGMFRASGNTNDGAEPQWYYDLNWEDAIQSSRCVTLATFMRLPKDPLNLNVLALRQGDNLPPNEYILPPTDTYTSSYRINHGHVAKGASPHGVYKSPGCTQVRLDPTAAYKPGDDVTQYGPALDDKAASLTRGRPRILPTPEGGGRGRPIRGGFLARGGRRPMDGDEEVFDEEF